jgi:hypothetical protein
MSLVLDVDGRRNEVDAPDRRNPPPRRLAQRRAAHRRQLDLTRTV